MNLNNNNDAKQTWRSWLIKKLLTKQTSKDDILQILNETSEIQSNIRSMDTVNQRTYLVDHFINNYRQKQIYFQKKHQGA